MRGPGLDRALVAGAAALGAAVVILAGATVIQLGGAPMGPWTTAAAYDAQAASLMATDRPAARRATQKALALSPVNAAAWLRLAQIDADSPTRLGERAASALGRSYAMGPYDADVLAARVAFSYQHWPDLTPDLRARCLSSVRTAWPIGSGRGALQAAAAGVTNPAGRLALAAELFSLTLEDQVETNARAKAAQVAN